MVHCGRNMDDLLLRVPGMNVDLVARFFKSASKFYHAGTPPPCALCAVSCVVYAVVCHVRWCVRSCVRCAHVVLQRRGDTWTGTRSR
jgi:hypothetical protein